MIFTWSSISIYAYSSSIVTKSWHLKAISITGPLWGESTGDQWIPFKKGPVTQSSDAEQTIKVPEIWDNWEYFQIYNFSKTLWYMLSRKVSVKWLIAKCLGPSLIGQQWFRYRLGVIRQQATTWTNVDPDLCCHKASLGHNELNISTWLRPQTISHNPFFIFSRTKCNWVAFCSLTSKVCFFFSSQKHESSLVKLPRLRIQNNPDLGETKAYT